MANSSARPIKEDQAHSALERFPTLFLTVAMMLTGMVLSWLGWNTYQSYHAASIMRERYFRVQELQGEALDALRRAQRPYDFAVIDAQMPGIDGFGLAAAVQEDPRLAATPLVMLTSAGQRGDGERCRRLGIRGYLNKPIARSDLLEVVALVLTPPAALAARAPTPEVITRHTIAESRRSLRILLAEDNPVNQQVAATMLRKRGHQVDIVGDGAQAIEAVRSRAYQIVLMDVQMPVMDGLAATAAIRGLPNGRDVPIVALTAHALAGDRERCLAAGMNGYLTKPFKAHELFAAVETATAPVTPPALLPPVNTVAS